MRSGPPPKFISQLSGEGDGGEGEEGDEEGGEVRGEEEGPRCCQVYQASDKPLKHLLFRGSEKPELFWWSSTAVSDLPRDVFLLTPRLRALLNALRCLGPLLEQLVQRVHL